MTTINVRDKGAVGDGVTNDQPAIQAALAAAQPGDTVYLPAGTYLLDWPRPLPNTLFTLLAVRKGVTIQGEDQQGAAPVSILKVAGGLNGTQTSAGTWAFPQFLVLMPPGPWGSDAGFAGNRFANFTIDFNGAMNGYGPAPGVDPVGVHFNWGIGSNAPCHDVLIKNVTFLNNPGEHCVAFFAKSAAAFSQAITIGACTFHNVADAVPGSAALDHSSVFIQGHESIIGNCAFICDTPSNVATSVEVYGNTPDIHDNRSTNYSIGCNLAARLTDLVQASLTSNLWENVNIGVALWSTADTAIRQATIQGDRIVLRPAANNFGGIFTKQVMSRIAGLDINNCTILSRGLVAGKASAAAGIMLIPGADALMVAGNTFVGLPGRAVDVYGACNGAMVEDNELIDCGMGVDPYAGAADSYQEGIAFHLSSGQTIKVRNNFLMNTTSTGMRRGIVLAGAITDFGIDEDPSQFVGVPAPIVTNIS